MPEGVKWPWNSTLLNTQHKVDYVELHIIDQIGIVKKQASCPRSYRKS